MGLDHYLCTRKKGNKKEEHKNRDFRKNYHLQNMMEFYLGDKNLLECKEERITKEMYQVILGRLEMYEKKIITLSEFIPEVHYILHDGEWGEEDYKEMVEVLKKWIPENVNWEEEELYYNCWY